MATNGKAALVAYWCNTRESIRLKRAAGEPAPWTDDTILASRRFCNVRREHDRVTQWIARHWRTPYAQHHNLTLAMVLARYLNWPPTLAAVGFPERWDPSRTLEIMRRRAKAGDRVWNSAYMISTCGQAREKAAHVVDAVSRTQGMQPGPGETLEGFWGRLTKIDGLGSFLAAQVVADIKNAPGNPLAKAPDWWSFCAPGPGSERGVRWYIGYQKPVAAFYFPIALKQMADEVGPLLDPVIGRLCMQDWQNVACEISKYAKAKEGGRMPRRLYRSTEQDYAL